MRRSSNPIHSVKNCCLCEGLCSLGGAARLTLLLLGLFLMSAPAARAADVSIPSASYAPSATAPAPLVPILKQTRQVTPMALPLESAAEDASDPSSMGEADAAAVTVADGRRLVAEKRWGEAKTLLEDALKHQPDHRALRGLYLESRAHLEVAARYHDRTFCDFLAHTNKEEMISLCDEVLENIETWHVDAPDWDYLFQRGIASLAIALSEEPFLRQNRVSEEVRAALPEYTGSLVRYASGLSSSGRLELRGNIFRVAASVQRGTGISGISVIMELLCGMVNSLDSYSAWLTSGQVNDLFSLIDGHFIGLGVYLDAQQIPGTLVITKVIPGSPACSAGLKSGDRIRAIDGQTVVNEQSAERLQGPEGSRVTLTVESDDQPERELTIVRRPFDFPSVEDIDVRPSDSGVQVATIRITSFQKSTVDEVRGRLRKIENSAVGALVIDLRNNPGGLLDKAIELSNLFLENGTIVQTKGRSSSQVRRADAYEAYSVPLVLLIDGNSASAAEIFAGAMQENGRAVVVGSRSYGKGTIQAIIQIESHRDASVLAGLRLTTEKFFSPNGHAYSGFGVTPDIDLSTPDTPKGQYTVARPVLGAEAAEEDPVLQRGIAEARLLAGRRGLAGSECARR
ncbi:MAG: S41 family peptidase [Thermoguttaceae bacterium]|nr:S41 family peptidase [Thermoguttaceae bacterium]